MFRNKTVDPGIPEKIINRVQKMTHDDLVTWSDQAIYTTGRYLTAHLREASPESIDEARTGAQVLLAITDELKRRMRG